MKTTVSVTSIHQYHAMQMFGQIAPKQLLILHKMRPGRLYSRRELSKLTGLETSCVAGRVNELLEMQQLEVVGTLRCSITHRHVEAVRLRDVQADIFGVMINRAPGLQPGRASPIGAVPDPIHQMGRR